MLPMGIIQCVCHKHQARPMPFLLHNSGLQPATNRTRGKICVQAVTELRQEVQNLDPAHCSDAVILPLYAALPPDQQVLPFCCCPLKFCRALPHLPLCACVSHYTAAQIRPLANVLVTPQKRTHLKVTKAGQLPRCGRLTIDAACAVRGAVSCL